jgi:DMATS type aromatic prenyltransferase
MASFQVLPVVEASKAKTRDQKTFLSLLSTILAQASYAPELQQQYISFWTTHVLPYLKYFSLLFISNTTLTRPSTFPTWTSNLTHNGSPFEPSRNLQNGQSTVRFCLEPLSSVAGTPSDPFNQAASLALVEELGRLDVIADFNRELWDFFTKEYFIWDTEEVEKVMGIVSQISFSYHLQKKRRNRLC